MSFSLIFCCTSGTDTVDLNSLTERRPPVVHEPYRIRYQGWPLVVVFVPHNRRVNSLSTSWNWTVSNRCIVATDMLPLQPYDGHVRWPKIIFTSKSKSFIIQSEIGITIKRALATRFAFTRDLHAETTEQHNIWPTTAENPCFIFIFFITLLNHVCSLQVGRVHIDMKGHAGHERKSPRLPSGSAFVFIMCDPAVQPHLFSG